MAVLLNGLLGKASGKIGNMVTASWKGINYARAHVIPANPNTTAQQAVRSKSSFVVEFGKQILSSVIQPYWNGMYPKMSGFNAFSKINNSLADASSGINENNFSMVGSLEGTTIGTMSYGTDTVTVNWSTSIIGNGEDTDKVLIVIWDTANKVAFVSDNATTRSTGTLDIIVGSGRTSTDLLVFVSFYRGTAPNLLKSNSVAQFLT